jgi:hypothetical protein
MSALIHPVCESVAQVPRRRSPSAPPPALYRGLGAVYRMGAAVSRLAAGSACSRSVGAAYRAGEAVYRGEAGGIPRTGMDFFCICVALGFRICVRI